MKLEGSLDTFPLRELVDMVVYSSVTGVLNIYGSGDNGHLYFRDSVLYHVERGSATGVDALAELLELSNANFSFVSEIVSDERSLHGAVSTHMQVAERISTRWRQIRAYVPTLELIPYLIGAKEALIRRVSPAHISVLDAIDGRASLRQIAVYLGWSPIDTAEAAAEMSVDGIVELRSSRQASSQGGGLTEAAPRGEGLFDRILALTPARPLDHERPHQPEAAHRSPADDLILRVLRG